MNKTVIIGKAKGSMGAHLNKTLKTKTILPDFDVRDDEMIEMFFESNQNEFQNLIYTAGIYEYSKIVDADDRDWMNQIDVNLVGAMRCIKHFARTQKGGTIILIGSNASKVPSAGSSAYCVSKAGMKMLTKVAGQELAPDFHIIQLDLGIVEDTNMYHNTYKNMGVSEEEMLDVRLKAVPMNRCMSKDELADWIEFLITRGYYANGVSLEIDGGKIKSSGKDD
ncbi:MAG TPA: SDR family oxidoreductase [Candidatus Nanoarchaeia archaeon]|nr:SDR family oxidoreductase [Candidatus Nanoarchaeia archaeon]